MDVFARLNQVRLNKDGGDNYIDRNIAELVKMARREKFSEYSEIIYYMAAQMELERGNLAAAQDLLLRGVNKQGNDPQSRNLIFLKVADLSYNQRKYVAAASFYDSVLLNNLKPEEVERVNQRKPQLSKVVFFSNILTRQDSLQRIAAMSEEDRKEYITKMVKRLRKQQGLTEEANAVTAGRGPATGPAPDLFNNQQQNRGEWYFYNDNLKAQGAQQFKQVWGNRPNTDNWRRFSDVSKQLVAKTAGSNQMAPGSGQARDQAADEAGQVPTYASLLAKLPLTPEAIQRSNDSVRNSLFSLGTIYLREMEDYVSAIETFEKLRGLFPDFSPMDELAYHLYFAYSKTGDVVKAALFKNMLKERFPSSRYTAIVFTGKDPSVNTEQVKQVTKTYEGIYDMFIEGRFAEAVEAKRRADSTYQTTQWQPQLLYIDAVYRIKNREDSAAKQSLNTLIAQDPNAPMAQKAKTMLDVLARRQQIEDELNRLEIVRPMDSTLRSNSIAVADKPAMQPKVEASKPLPVPEIRQEEDLKLSGEKQRGLDASGRLTGVSAKPGAPRLDTTGGRKLQFAQPKASSTYSFDVGMQHFAVVVLNKVDVVFTNESKNAFARFSRERFYTQNPGTNIAELDSANRMVLIGPFTNAQDAIDYVVLAKKLAPSDIVPWLKPERYSFTIISPNNLEILQNDKDLSKYRKFIEAQVPGKF
jgi:outer membrane protein assembly factor BamD (BamD/ComL family)